MFCAWAVAVALSLTFFRASNFFPGNMPEGETYPKAVLLGIAFACNVGGMTTPIASPQVRARACLHVSCVWLQLSSRFWQSLFVLLTPFPCAVVEIERDCLARYLGCHRQQGDGVVYAVAGLCCAVLVRWFMFERSAWPWVVPSSPVLLPHGVGSHFLHTVVAPLVSVVLTLVIFGYLWLALRPAVVGIRQKKRRKVCSCLHFVLVCVCAFVFVCGFVFGCVCVCLCVRVCVFVCVRLCS